MSEIKNNRVGEVSYTKYGTKAIIVEYKSNKDVVIEFQDKYKYRYSVTYLNFKNGTMLNPFDKSAYGVGYIGIGEYTNISKSNKEIYHCYSIWRKMFERCYTTNIRTNRQKTYEDCYVCEEWHNFQNFAEWYMNHKYKIQNEKLCIDKDILVHGNKVYSPETCLLVPNRINSLFAKSYAIRGDLPIGVTYYWYDNSRYLASMKTDNRKTYQIGIFNNPMSAFEAYKKEKEKYIKEVAEEYKSVIPTELYDAMYKYKILITD